LPANDDESTGSIPLPFPVDFYGTTYESMYINNNGNVTFDAPLETYTPFGIAGSERVIIAPFFADVDTRPAGSDVTQYGYGDALYEGHRAFCVNWVNVGYYNQHTDKLNSFQLLLVEREDAGVGAFDIVFNYDTIQWETGDASGGVGGLGGVSAYAGFSNGGLTSYELAGSGVNGAFLDSSPSGLSTGSFDSTQPGRYLWRVRGSAPPTNYVALGDSFQSGEGAGNYEAGTDVPGVNMCHRSYNAYPHRLVDTMVVQLDLDFGACSGAVIGDLSEAVDSGGPPWDDGVSQYSRLGDDTRLVTIGIGGNDMEFGPVLTDCVLWGFCERRSGERITENLTALTSPDPVTGLSRLQSTYDEVRRLAPYAQVLVVGYPRFFVPGGANEFFGFPFCSGIGTVNQRWIDDSIRRFNDVIGPAARSMGAKFVDVYNTPAGHELCSDEEEFLNGIVQDGFGVSPESFHPNSFGHGLLADAVGASYTAGPAGTPFDIFPGETVTSSYAVAGGSSVSFSSSWPGSDVVMSLISPSGRVIERGSTDSDVIHRNGPTYEVFTVTNPEPGDWQVSLFGAQVALLGEETHLSVVEVPEPNGTPVAELTVTQAGNTVTVDGSSSTDPDGTIVDYEWDFGDGTVSSGSQVTHTYAEAGTYVIALAVTDSQGGEGFNWSPTQIVIAESHYAFSGFHSPVEDPPAVNTTKAGSTVPLKFGLGGDYGLDVLAADFPASQQVDCSTGEVLSPLSPTTASGGSGLTYDPATDVYQYNWKTQKKGWGATCRNVVLRFDDGSEYFASFKFK